MQLVVRRAVLSLLFFTSLLAFYPLHGQTQDLDELLESARAAQSTGELCQSGRLLSSCDGVCSNRSRVVVQSRSNGISGWPDGCFHS
jgi:hypothetical protein